jgi:hypothetical protein
MLSTKKGGMKSSVHKPRSWWNKAIQQSHAMTPPDMDLALDGRDQKGDL